MDLVTFLRARLADNEAAAKRADAVTVDMDEPLTLIEGDEFTFFAINPARVLADIEAKRRIVDEHAPRQRHDGALECPTCVYSGDDIDPAPRRGR